MDPQAALEKWRRAVARGDKATAREAKRDLQTWLRGGGFQPRWASPAEKAKFMGRARNPGRKVTRKRASKNPLRHFPKLKGRGRPTKLKTWELTTVLSNGAVGRSSMRATTEQAHAKANQILKKRYMGKKVREVIVDDGK